MKQILFETRQKADELLKEALSVWRQSDQADFLEGIEKDPVFSLLMMALAYQSNEVDGEIERLKAEVLEDFSRLLVPYELGHAVPATALVEARLQSGIGEMTMGENQVFQLNDQHPFIPLLETRVLNAEVRSVVRLDGRRWKVSLNFKHPVKDLSGFAFGIKDILFRNLEVSVKGQLLPLVKPWYYSELPMAPCFAMDSLTYNHGQFCQLWSLPMDLFARQNVRLFSIDRHNPKDILPMEAEKLDLVFEFVGVPDNFVFDKDCLILNPVILVNAQVHEASISSANPVARLAGGSADTDPAHLSDRQFLHLVRPLENQLFGNMELEVRGVAGDRFNQGSLLKLLTCLITKYRSDFYGFQDLKGPVTDNAIYQLENALSSLKEESSQNVLRSVAGVYLMPRGRVPKDQEFSLSVKYLTTAGAAVNESLNGGIFTPPSGFNAAETHTVGVPVPGIDELQDESVLGNLLRYNLLTGDRIVTMADIKLFCYKELLHRYGIGADLVRRLHLNRRLQQEGVRCGYEMVAEITLVGNSFVRRSFADKLPMAEILLEKMIEVRSTNIYPVRIHINIEEE